MPQPVVVVGGGIAGAACARALRAGGAPVVVLDRGRAPGGRLSSRTVDGRAVDTGARYLTVQDEAFEAVVRDWEERGLAAPWTTTFHLADPEHGVTDVKDGPVRWSSPRGSRALVVDLLAGTDVRSSVAVTRAAPGADGLRVDAEDLAGGDATSHVAPAVVLAAPDAQAARVVAAADLPRVAAALDRPAWTPQLALLAGWGRRRWADDLDGAFISGSDVLEWVADDGRRRGDHAPVLVAHSTSPFAAQHLGDPDAALAPMLAELRRTLTIEDPPAWARVQRWSLASPAEPRDEPFGLLTEGGGLVGLCGDGWGGKPKVETAFTSGRLLGEELARRLA